MTSYSYMLWECETKVLEEDILRAKQHFQAKYPFKFVTILVHKDVQIKDTIPLKNILKGSVGVAYE